MGVILFILLVFCVYIIWKSFSKSPPKSIDSDSKQETPTIIRPNINEDEQEYRRPDDPPHIIRIDQPRPQGLPKKIAEYINVAGISQPEYQKVTLSFIHGKQREIELERDPMNQYDPNAIKVIGTWVDESGVRHREQLGWVPAKTAKEIAENYPDARIGASLEAIFLPREGKSAGLRIDVWGPRAKQKSK